MTMNYHFESSHIADYDLYTLPGIGFTLRGPRWPLHASTPSISFLGAAQTFGAFCKYPFANLIGEMCSARVLNLGRGGAGPGYYLKQPKVFEYVNTTKCCIVQVMSARSSIENSYMTAPYGLASVEIKKGQLAGQTLIGHNAFQKLFEELPRGEFLDLIRQTREAYIEQMIDLSAQIKVPKVLLYVGRNEPLTDATLDENSKFSDIFGIHPHMITKSMVARMGAHFDQTVIVHGSEGFDQRLMSRFTGEFVSVKRSETYTVNSHDAYISPTLHVKAAQELYPTISAIIRGRSNAQTR
ncbi:hypothetical protein GCM10010991_15280 [Gemmobacter aquaticus]|uniref:DUF6473 domain-containing protein n=1 Tax=Gemmobacter aquaticus TaxID=490185 RepID=A0A917YJA5_9RHOB|nr:DUF6473 family protein [Gemmobacter aquaticus]GGO30432.1 hypothetical protein GCM10010991_15280 [Gemmobacter aquaticus]